MGLFDRILSALGLRKRGGEIEDEPTSDDDRNEPAADGSAESAVDDTDDDGDNDGDNDNDAGDDVERDSELEAQDDCASFDFERDIARFFTAEFRVEQAWNNPARRERLFAEYEVRDGAHWYQVKATFARWLESAEGKAKYPTEAALVQARMTTTQTVTIDELEAMIEDARRDSGEG